MPQTPAPYPNVSCSLPGHLPATGYMACIHVVDKGATPSPFHYRAPSATRLGTICCAKPLAQHSTKKELVLLCSACALVNGWLPDEAVMMMRSPNHG